MIALSRLLAGHLELFAECYFVSSDLGALWEYCRGLLSALPRKSFEPIALQWGTPARTLQRFLRTSIWDHERMRDLYHAAVGGIAAVGQAGQAERASKLSALSESIKSDDLGANGLIDETSVAKKGDVTPGVQRQ